MENSERAKLYREAGVDIGKGDALVEWLQGADSQTKTTKGGSVVSGIGGFGALFRPNFSKYKDPLLVSATDGVGTKVLLAQQLGILDGLGQDLVAMCANDLLTMGAQPLFFLDYYATGQLEDKTFKSIISGIRRGVNMCGATLVGGETAEMPGLYSKGHFDLAGFMVGIVDSSKVCGPSWVKAGDSLIGLASSGFHSNGYSLIRKWLANSGQRDSTLLSQLLAPTLIYGEIVDLVEKMGPEKIHAMAHITGGGISGNLVRVLPQGVKAQVIREKIPTPEWMKKFILENGATIEEVEPVFNLGVGMILVVSAGVEDEVIKYFSDFDIAASILGQVVSGKEEPTMCYV